MSLPDQLLLSDLLIRRVRCDRGLEHGVGQIGWMHPPVHRLLGWASRPSALSSRRCVWRLDQLRGLAEAEVLVEGDPADTDPETLERLPTLLGAVLLSGRGEPLGRLADAAFDRRNGRILHYLVARSDPRLPGGSRWRLSPDRIVDQRPGEVNTALEALADLPLARASLRETLLRRSRRWREQWEEETGRLRDQWQQASGRFEERLEGWIEDSPWEDSGRPPRSGEPPAGDIWPDEAWPAVHPEARRSDAGPPPDEERWGRGAAGPRREDDDEDAPIRRSPAPFRERRRGIPSREDGSQQAEPWEGIADDRAGAWPDEAPGPSSADGEDGSQDWPEAMDGRRRPRPLGPPPAGADDPWV